MNNHLLRLALLLLPVMGWGQIPVKQVPISGYYGNAVDSPPISVQPIDTTLGLSVTAYYNSSGAALPSQLQPTLRRTGLVVTVHWDSSSVWIAPRRVELPASLGWYRLRSGGQTIWDGPISMSRTGLVVTTPAASVFSGLSSQIAVLQDGYNSLRVSTLTLSAYTNYTTTTANTLATYATAISGLSSATASLAAQIAQNSSDIANRVLISTYASGTTTQATRDAGQDVQIALKLPGSFSTTQAGVDGVQNTSIVATNTALSAFTTNQATVDAGQNTGITNAQSTATAALSLASSAVQVGATYNNPSWLNQLSFSKLIGLPTTRSGYGITDAEGTITAGTTGQYWRGDKSWQALNSSAVGLGNVNNTSDANKPVSTATQTALDTKLPASYSLTQSGIDGTQNAKLLATATATSIGSTTLVTDNFDTTNQAWNGRKTPTGQIWSVSGPGQSSSTIVNGVALNGGNNMYATLQYGAPITYIAGTFSYIPVSTTATQDGPQAVIIAQKSTADLGTMLHFQLFWNSWSIQKRTAGGAFIGIGGGTYVLETNGTQYRGGMRINGAAGQVTLELPDGSETIITDPDITTLSPQLTAGTWQIQQSASADALVPRWHSVVMGQKRFSSQAVGDGATTPANVERVSGYGFGRRTSKKFVFTSGMDGWYRIAYHTPISAYTIQGKIKLATTGLVATMWDATIFATSSSNPRVVVNAQNGAYHLANVRVGTDPTGAYVDVQIANTAASTVTLAIDAEGFINLYANPRSSPTVPALSQVFTPVTPAVTTMSGSVTATGWYRLSTETSGPAGYLNSGTIRIKASDAGRYVIFDCAVTATPSALQPIQIWGVSGSSVPISQIRISRQTNQVAVDAYFPYASTNTATVEASYYGFFTPVTAPIAVTSALTSESAVANVTANFTQTQRSVVAPDAGSVNFLILTEGGSYAIGVAETSIYHYGGTALTATTLVLPTSPVAGQVVTFTSAVNITTLTVSPGSGTSVNVGSTAVSANNAKRWVYRSANATWYPQ